MLRILRVDKYVILLRKKKNVERPLTKPEEAEEESKEKRKPEAVSLLLL